MWLNDLKKDPFKYYISPFNLSGFILIIVVSI